MLGIMFHRNNIFSCPDQLYVLVRLHVSSTEDRRDDFVPAAIYNKNASCRPGIEQLCYVLSPATID